MSETDPVGEPRRENDQLDSTIRGSPSSGNSVRLNPAQEPTQEVAAPDTLVERGEAAVATPLLDEPNGSPIQSEAALHRFLESYPKEKYIYDELARVAEELCKDGLGPDLGTKFLTMSRGKAMRTIEGTTMTTLEQTIRKLLHGRLTWPPKEGHFE